METPDYIEPVIGFRQWLVNKEGYLEPYYRTQPLKELVTWLPGVSEARCYKTAYWPSRVEDYWPDEHSAPHPQCKCGLYGYKLPFTAELECFGCQDGGEHILMGVSGAFAAWGQIEVHGTGIRAQYAIPVVFSIPLGAGPAHRQELKHLAARYGAELVMDACLYNKAGEHGRLLAKPEEAKGHSLLSGIDVLKQD